MGHILKLLYGIDPAHPGRTLDLNEADNTLSIRRGGFSPGPGEARVTYSGLSSRRDGQKLIKKSRDNARFDLTYQLRGNSTNHIASLQAQIIQYANDCINYETAYRSKPVWLLYSWDTSGLGAPVYGQFFQYYKVIDIEPRWPGSLHEGLLQVSTAIIDVICTFVCEPYPYGLPQLAATGQGQLQLFDDGVLVPDGITNVFTNPSFNHPTDWDNSWSVSNVLLLLEQETRPDFTRESGTAVRLINTNTAGTTHSYYTTSTPSGNYVISAYVKKLDSSAVTTNDLLLYMDDNAIAGTSFISVGDGWYLAYATANCSGASTGYGISVKAGKSFVATDFLLEASAGNIYGANNKPSPFTRGDMIGCSWAGTAYESTSTRPGPLYKWTMENEVTGIFTVSFWVKTLWANTWPAADITLWDYYVDADNRMLIQFDYTNDYFKISKEIEATTDSDTGSAQTIAYGDKIHLCWVQSDGTAKLYVNGSEDCSVATEAVIAPDGTMSLGCQYDGSEPGNVIVDGLKIWEDALSAAEVAALYANESAVKADGKSLSPIPVFWTKDGDGGIDAVDGVVSTAAKDNWGVLVGTPGTEPALTEIHFDPPTTTPPYVYWIGRLEADQPFIPDGTLWHDFSGTADSGASSGDAYEKDTTGNTGSDTHDFDSAVDDARALRGRFQVLARAWNAQAAYDWQAYFKLGLSDQILFPKVRQALDTAFGLRDFKDIFINWNQRKSPPTMSAGLLVTETTTISTSWDGIIEAWDLDDVNPDYASHTLTSNNGVTFAAGKIGNSASMVAASSQYLSIAGASAGDFSFGNVSFSGECWVRFDTTASVQMLISKNGGSGTDREYYLYYDNSVSRFKFSVSNDGTAATTVTANTFGAPSTATWYYVVFKHDATNNIIGISVNNGAFDTAAHTTGAYAGSADLTLGAGNNGALYFLNGDLDAVAIYNGVLSAADITNHYNGGTGKEYSADEQGTVYADFMCLLPWPYVRVEVENSSPTFGAGDTIVVNSDLAAWVQDASDNESPLNHCFVRGEPLTVIPHKYNHLIWLLGADGAAYDVTDAVTNVKIYVTPRWTLPGQAVG